MWIMGRFSDPLGTENREGGASATADGSALLSSLKSSLGFARETLRSKEPVNEFTLFTRSTRSLGFARKSPSPQQSSSKLGSAFGSSDL